MFRGEDEDDFGQNEGQGVAIGNQMISKENIMGEIFSRVATVQTASEGVSVPGAGGETSGGVNMQAEKSIKDIIEERQAQLKDLEQLQDMTQSQFVDALTNDIDGTAGPGTSAVVEALTSKKGTESTTEGASGANNPSQATAATPKNPAASAFEEMQEKLRADLATLVEEKEAEIQQMVTVLDSLKAEIGKSEITTDSLQN